MDQKVGAQYFREEDTHIANKHEEMLNIVSDQRYAH